MTRILIVDDKAENLYMLRALLTGHGYSVEEACHGAEALVKARGHPPDLIISDLLMPVMDGYTTLMHWKADERLKGIPFVVYTATYTDPKDEKLALDLGADAFIIKPTEPEPFLERIRTVLEARKRGALLPVRLPAGDEEGRILQYNESLIRKLEEKARLLGEANRALEQDIIERKRAEQKVAESRQQLQAILDNSPALIIVKDTSGRYLVVNREWERVMGVTREAALGKTARDILPSDVAERSHRREAEILETGAARQDEETLALADGIHTYLVTRFPLHSPQGGSNAVCVIATDITERKRLEKQLLQAQKMEAIGQLTSGIAHDFNNMLQIILAYAGFAQKEFPRDSHGWSDLEKVKSAATQAAHLSRQMLTFSRQVETTMVSLDLRVLIKEIARMFEKAFPANISVSYEFDREIPHVRADPTQMHQVLLNLCVNARDAMPNGGQLRLALTMEHVPGGREEGEFRTDGIQDFVVLVVGDTGAGIPKEHLDKVYDPFFTTKDVGKGTGLGLATTYGIVKQHGGYIECESKVGEGTVFRVYLPARMETERPPTEPNPRESLPGGEEHILVVEDNDAIRALIHRTLSCLGYQVRAVEDGREALEIYKRDWKEIALTVLDLQMPRLDGLECHEAMRAINPQVKAILSSGFCDAELQSRMTASGVSGFLQKPYSPSALAKKIREILDRAEPSPDDWTI